MKASQQFENLRSSWVNGNRSHVAKQLLALQKRTLLAVLEDGLLSFYENLNNPPGTFSGELTDILEMLSYIRRNL